MTRKSIASDQASCRGAAPTRHWPCVQDFPDHYLFRTTQVGPNRVVIEAAWPPDKAGAAPTTSGAYRLTLSKGVWKIDGVACAGGDSYNWSTR